MTDVLEVQVDGREDPDSIEGLFGNLPPAPTDTPVRRRLIRELFKELGGMVTTRDLARECLRRGVWNETDREIIVLRSVQSQVRAALSGEDSSGLPFAGQTTEREDSEDGHARIWKIREQWLFADYELNVNIRATQMVKLDQTVHGLSRECETRYGKAPEIKAIPIDDEEVESDDA